jgi:hypothetical protein
MDIDMTPITGRIYDPAASPPATNKVIPATITEDLVAPTKDQRLRVDALVSGFSILPTVINLADNTTVPDGTTFPVGGYIIDISSGISKFSISSSMTSAATGTGYLRIEYRVTNTSAWRIYEDIPFFAGQSINKFYIPSRQFYRISYFDNNDLINTTTLDLVIIEYPIPT